MDARMILPVGFAALLLAGCEDVKPSPEYSIDQTVRAERFDACLRLVPAGPLSTTYNDWAEVVEECESAASYQAKKCARHCDETQLHNPIGGTAP